MSWIIVLIILALVWFFKFKGKNVFESDSRFNTGETGETYSVDFPHFVYSWTGQNMIRISNQSTIGPDVVIEILDKKEFNNARWIGFNPEVYYQIYPNLRGPESILYIKLNERAPTRTR